MASIKKIDIDTVSVDTDDMPQFQLKVENSNEGRYLHLINYALKYLDILKYTDNAVCENYCGQLMFYLKTKDEKIGKLRFVYDSGFYLDWDITNALLDKKILDEFIEEIPTMLIGMKLNF